MSDSGARNFKKVSGSSNSSQYPIQSSSSFTEYDSHYQGLPVRVTVETNQRWSGDPIPPSQFYPYMYPYAPYPFMPVSGAPYQDPHVAFGAPRAMVRDDGWRYLKDTNQQFSSNGPLQPSTSQPSREQPFSSKDSFPPSSSHPSMSVSGIQGPHLVITVVACKILKDDEVLPGQHLYAVIKYCGRKYKKEGSTGNFEIKLTEGLSDMDIFVSKSNSQSFIGTGKIGLHKVLTQGFDWNVWPLKSSTTSGSYSGEVTLVMQYPNATLYNASPVDDSPGKVEESRRTKGSLHPSNSEVGSRNSKEVTEKLNNVKISKEEDISSFKSSGGFLRELEKNTPKQFSHNELKKFTSGFTDKVGSGGFGNVYKGQHDGAEVAVKGREDRSGAENNHFHERLISSIKAMSVSEIQAPHLLVTVVDYSILKTVSLYPWQKFYAVIEYGGRKYKKEDRKSTTKENFQIELNEGLSEMEIYVLKGSEIFVGSGKFQLSQGLDNSNQSVILNTTNGGYVGEVALILQYSKAIVYNASDIMDSTNEVEESRRMKASLLPSNNMKVMEKLNEVVISKEEDIASFEPSGGFLCELEKITPKQFSPIDLKKFTSDFADKAGKGGFGTVYKGQFRDGVKIVVKVLEENGFAEKSFKAEVSTMFKTSHRNLVKFYGYCFDLSTKAVVYEYMENGSLDAILYGNPRKLEWQKFYKISVEIAKGISYLHDGCDNQIIHHDLKPANVLLDKNLSAKITDFGLARLIDKDLSHITWTDCGGTQGYMAPEICMPSSTITSKCDVYSFGMILFEVLRMKKNNVDSVWFPKQVWLKFDNGEIEELLDDLNIDKEEDRARAEVLCSVALWCTQFVSEERPSMSKVVMMLERQIPIEKPPNPHYL